MTPLPSSPTGPLWKNMPVSRAFSSYPSGFPASKPSLHLRLPDFPKEGALLQNEEKHKVTVQVTPRGRKAYIQWGMAWFPKGIVNDSDIPNPVPCSPWHDTFHLDLCRTEPLSPRRVVATLNRV